MTEGREENPPPPSSRWKRRLAIMGISLAVVLLFAGIGAILAWQNRTDLLAWGIAAYLKGDDVTDVSMTVTAAETDRLAIRDIRTVGKQTTTIESLNLAYEIDKFIGGTIDSLTVTHVTVEGGALPVAIDTVHGKGRFSFNPFSLEQLTAGLDLIRLTVGPQQFDPSRIEVNYNKDTLVLDSAFTSPDGYVTALGSGPLNKPGTPFRLLLSGRLNAALAAAPLAGIADAGGYLTFSISAQMSDPLFFMAETDDDTIKLPEEFTVDGTVGLALDRLTVLETPIPLGDPDTLRFRLETKTEKRDQATGAFELAIDAQPRDTPALGFTAAEARLKGRYDLTGSLLSLAIESGPLVKVREMRLFEALPVPGDIALQLLGGGNKVVADLAKKTGRHALESQLSWKSGELSLKSEGHLTDADDPATFTLRGAFDATPLLALSPLAKSASGNANLFLAGRISEPMLFFRADKPEKGNWPNEIRLDGAMKLETTGLAIPGATAHESSEDSIEIILKGFDGSDRKQGGRLAVNAALDTRTFGGTTLDQTKLALEGRLSFGTRGYRFVPGIDSVLNIQSLKTKTGVVIPGGLNFQLTGDDNRITIPADLSAVYHELTFAHLEANGYIEADKQAKSKRHSFLVTVPKITSRQTETDKLSVYLTGGSFDLAEDKLTGRGVNASLVETADGYDLGLETGEIRHEARPPMTTPITLSGKGKINGNAVDATFEAKQRYTPLKLLATVTHNLASEAGRMDFTVPKTAFGSKKPTLGDIFPPAENWFTASKGAAAASGHLLWDKEILSGQMAVKLDALDLTTEDMKLTDISGTLNFIELVPLSMPPRQRLTGNIATGELGPWPMNFEFQLREDGKVEVQDLDIAMAGGVVRTRATLDPAAEAEADGSVQLRSVDLRQLLELIGVEGLNGTGRITGTVPVHLRAGKVSVVDGLLNAEGPGVLRYQGTALQEQLSARADTVGTVAQVLSDFRYKKLSMTLNKSPEGMGTIVLHMEGANPSVLEGHPFAFNISLESDFHKLGRIAQGGLKAVSDVVQGIEKPAPTGE